MFQNAKNYMMKKLLEKQLKNAPPDQRDMILTLLEKDPVLFEKISKEIQTEVKAGKSQMSAALKVMPKYQKELQAIMGDKMQQAVVRKQARFNPNGSIHK